MKTKIPVVAFLWLAVILVFASTEIRPAQPPNDAKPYSIFVPPETVFAEPGTFVAFAVRVTPEDNVTYQWRFQTNENQAEVNITNANGRKYIIPSANVTNVGAYSVLVSWPGASVTVTSSLAFLSVLELHGTNSTIGTLTSSPLLFGPPASPGFSCFWYPTVIFNKYYDPVDGNGAAYHFYGPGVSTLAQYGLFMNQGHNKFIKIDTVSITNEPCATGVRLWKGFYNPTDSGEVDCESGDSHYTPIMEYYNMETVSAENQARYRVTIYYKTPPAPSKGYIVMHWLYFD